ncbi:MAG: AraC family transcriptional regulator [Salinisphaera sp.]|jgi:AraC-like DNA-binding protein|nr:AraC family transcriptional regulator [Salinisphaera sp.]
MHTSHHSRQLGEPVFESVRQDPRRSFYWHTHGFPSPVAKWNYHPEYELHLICRSVGRYMVGDYADRFGPGNLVLVGPNLPHAWFSDLASPATVIEDRDVVVQFRSEWLSALTQLCPELREIGPLIQASARGVVFEGAQIARWTRLMESMADQDDSARLLSLIRLLRELARCDYRRLASPHYNLEQAGVHSEQVDAILQHLHRHFDRSLEMAAIARWQGMTPSTFSRFFKRTTGDNFVAFVRRLRIEAACRLLLENEQSVSDVCFRVGYGNISNFNRHFKRLVGMTPREYRQASMPQRPMKPAQDRPAVAV